MAFLSAAIVLRFLFIQFEMTYLCLNKLFNVFRSSPYGTGRLMFSLVPNFILQALICGQLCDNMSYLNEVLMLVMLDSFKSSDCHAWRHNPSYHIIALAVCILFDFCLLPGRQDAFLQSSPTPVAPSSLAAMLMIRSSGLVIHFWTIYF